MERVDVLINVFSKPWQTALSLLTLLRHSGQWIDKIYFHEEPAHFFLERTTHERLLAYLKDRLVYFQPQKWVDNEPVERSWLEDPDYRLAMRYQYGFENSDKRRVLVIHNDIVVQDDVVGYLLDAIEGYSGVGQIGQCWWCPAQQNGLCKPESYESFRPDFPTLNALYTEGFEPLKRRAYHYGWGEQFQRQPWPLPECRLNEWCALIDREKTRPDTFPLGTATPLGAQTPSGALIGENFDEPVNLDTGVQWFRDLSHLGHRFKHVDIYAHVVHEKTGRGALLNPELYVRKEVLSQKMLAEGFPEFFAE